MSSKILHDAGEALYGPRWQSEMARDLGVNDRTVRRWASGATDIPSGLYVDLLRLVVERQADLDEIERRLKEAGAL